MTGTPEGVATLQRVKIYADGASLSDMTALYRQPYIRGFTTNPTLMHRAGVTEYAGFARAVLAAIPDRPISFEVFADDFATMERQARQIARWGDNVYVKIPVTNTSGAPAYDLIGRLSHAGIKVNVTAVLTRAQVEGAVKALAGGAPANVSVFAGRIADTGQDPVPQVRAALAIAAEVPTVEIIWASPREVLNVVQADQLGCHIITVTSDILNKLRQLGRGLEDVSLDTVRMFYDDAKKAGFSFTDLEQTT